MSMLPEVQGPGISKDAGVLGGHINGCPAKISETCLRKFFENEFFLSVSYRNGEIFTYPIATLLSRWVDTVRLSQFCGRLVNGLGAIGDSLQQIAAAPQWYQACFGLSQGLSDPLCIVA